MLAGGMEYGSPTPIIAFALAIVGGALLATSHYISGLIVVVLAVVLFGAWRFAQDRGDDDRHTIW
jgi:hypothetical protein